MGLAVLGSVFAAALTTSLGDAGLAGSAEDAAAYPHAVSTVSWLGVLTVALGTLVTVWLPERSLRATSGP